MSGRYSGSYMRAFKTIPQLQVTAANLSKDALRRVEWIDWYFSHGKNAEATCRHFGICKSLFYRWWKRYNKYNLKTLEFNPKTRRPQRVRVMTTAGWLQQKIYDIRKNDLEKSKYEIQEELKRAGILVGQSTIQKVINRNTELLNTQHKRRVRQRRKLLIARIKAEPKLREKDLGSLIQVDTKYLYVLGKKFYLFTAIDCKSRYGFVYGYKTISSASGRDFMRKVTEYFPFRIEAVNTDNGSEYLLNFHQQLMESNVTHYFTDPYCPKQNGRVERLHQTVEYEYFNYQEDLVDDLSMINEHCMKFNQKYNYERFHRSLGYKTPAEYVTILSKQKGL